MRDNPFKNWTQAQVDEFNARTESIRKTAKRIESRLISRAPVTQPKGEACPGSSQRVRERDLHDDFEKWLKKQGPSTYWVHCRMDKKSTTRKGTPDFVGWTCSKPWAVEFKVGDNKPSGQQWDHLLHARSAGANARACWSLEEAIKTALGINSES